MSSAERTQTLLFVRHALDEVLEATSKDDVKEWEAAVGRFAPAEKFAKWQSTEYRAGHLAFKNVRDPCLTECGAQVAEKGIGGPLRDLLAERGYAGPVGGLQPVGEKFDPELIVVSPMARALQTALCMFDNHKAPMIVQTPLAELTKDATCSGKFPEGKAGCHGMTRTMIQAAVDAHPRSSGGKIDLSHIEQDSWCDPFRTFEDKQHSFAEFLQWLAKRPERKIAVVTHGGLLKYWLNARFEHCEYGVGDFSYDEDHAATDLKYGGTSVVLTNTSEGVKQIAKVKGTDDEHKTRGEKRSIKVELVAHPGLSHNRKRLRTNSECAVC